MSEKLTKEEFFMTCMDMPTKRVGETLGIEQLWNRIKADQETIRAETREEVLKDHFKIGEEVQVRNDFGGDWCNHFVVLVPEKKSGMTWIGRFRRPPKMRPMTRDEKEKAIGNKFNIYGICTVLSDSALDELVRVSGINPEVSE